ncbi:MAG: methyltransferase domain-containing protein [Nitrospira defluvii]|nr:methyltransferase domain-containing protein [Nitrospira defluvii]
MSIPEPSLNILLINEHPDELKLVTSSLRGFFSDCRIEAGFSSEEALTFSQRAEWHIILIDQDLSPDSGLDILARIRRNAPYAAIILQTNQSDSQTAVQALQNGADFLLFKNSPGFVTELLFSVQEAVEKRDLQMKLDRTFQRHLRFMETVSDLLYELDQDGRFVYVSATVTALLGYTPEELAGQHYSILLPPLQEAAGRFRLNERRAGSRSVRRVELTLHRKALPDVPSPVISVEVTAKGLFDNAHRYIGTVGLLRDLSQEKAQQDRLTQLESRLQETDHQLNLSQEAARVSRQLQQPLTTLLQDSQRLLSAIQHSKIEQHVETMVAKASQASQLSQQLVQVIHARPSAGEPLVLNEILQAVVLSAQREPQGKELLLTSHFAMDLPIILGSRDAVADLARILLDYAQRCTAGATTPSRLTLHTEPLTVQDNMAPQGDPAFDPRATRTYATFSIQEVVGDTVSSSPALPEGGILPEEFLRAHRIVQAHGGAIEIARPPDKGLTIKVRIPAIDIMASPGTREKHGSSSTASIAVPNPSRTGIPNPATQPHDRRQFERRLLSLPVELTIGNSTLRGVLRNMSTRGALLAIRDLSPSVHLQPAYVVIKTPVSFLELQGVVHERPPAPAETTVQSIKEIVISFTLTSEHDRDVLQSLLDGLQEGSTTVTFEALILPPFPAVDGRQETISYGEWSEDRREAVRLAVARPIRLAGSEHRADRPLGLILNLSRDGACLELSGHPDSLAVHQVIQLIPVGPIAQPSGASASEESDEPWTARVIWTRIRRIDATSHLAPATGGRFRLGVRFEHLSAAQEYRLRSIITPAIGSSHDLAEPMSDAPVVTVSHALRNRDGHMIALCHDSPRQSQATALPIVLLCSGYGMPQQAYVAFAYFLAGSGLRVLRYDHSRHIGLSDGDPVQTTFTSLEDDLDTVLAFTQKEWPGASLTVLAPDLLGRIALRRQDWHRLIRRLILLNPTLDLRNCLTALHHRDVVQEHLAGSRLGLGNLMGIPLDMDHFLTDAVAAQYADTTALHEDLTHCETDVVFLTAGPDAPELPIPGPSPALLNDAMRLLGLKSSRVSLPSPILTAGDIAPKTLQASWQRLRQLCHPPDALAHSSAAALQPISRSTAIRARFERDQLRAKYAVGTAASERLWNVQTNLTQTLDELPTYWQYIDQLYQLVQPLDGGLALLDVGCGIHSFARLLLLNLSYRLRAQTWRHSRPIRYVGMDLSPSALHAAQAATKDALRHVDSLFSGRISGPTPVAQSWVLGRSLEALPFADHSFDRIVANLSLSFAPSPLHTLRELFRVLRPGGKLVVSAFTPSADVALLYRPPLQELGIDAFTGDTRLTLNRMAQCCKALRVGQLHAFEEDTLSARLSQITPTPVRLLRVLSGHILLAAAEKPDSSG